MQTGRGESGSQIAEKLIISDDLASKSTGGSPRPDNLTKIPENGLEPLLQKQDIDAETKLAKCGTQETAIVQDELKSLSDNVTKISCSKQMSVLENLGLRSGTTVIESALENLESQQLIPIVKDGTQNASQAGLEVQEAPLSSYKSDELGSPTENEAQNSNLGHLGSQHHDGTIHHIEELFESSFSTENEAKNSSLGHLDHHDRTKSPSMALFESTDKVATDDPIQPVAEVKGTPMQSRKRRQSSSGPPVNSTRVLRSRSKDKPETPEPNNVAAEVTDDGEKKRKRKRTIKKETPVNEFSRIKNHLRYLLHRIKYEQNLIDAYCAEGWKGQSLEKLKPEKELQRAKSHILRYKLKIRDLFERVDLSLAEGKIPESLFDSDGEIDSEHIFCAKCGSKDLPDDNDIILCDGACERGFHQFCLEPPLLKEDIPPGDTGWLCPGCDCKLDCIDLVNDFHGTDLSVLDNWEKVFPEAAAASGNTVHDGSGIPSDDSEDDDYDPDKPEVDEKIQEDETSSDESDYFSASVDLEASPAKEQYLGLPSEDSEDDDFDPNLPDHDDQAKQESSSSDFTSDSEDLGAVLDDNRLSGKDQDQASHDGEKLEMGGVNGQSLRNELSYLLDSNEAPISGKRHVERLDYKKLHDDTYGNSSSDSSDEDFEDYEETAGGKGRKHNSGKISGERSSVVANELDIKAEDSNQKDQEHTPKRTRKKLDVERRNNLSTSHGSSSEAGSGSKSGRSIKRLGEVVTQRLFESFKENQYPERPVKEKLAKELGLTIQQVSKWFENARWSYRHSATMQSKVTKGASRGQTSSQHSNEQSPDLGRKIIRDGVTSIGVDKAAEPEATPRVEAVEVLATEQGGEQKSGKPKSRKRKDRIDDELSHQNSSQDKKLKEKSQADAPNSQQMRRSGRLQSGNSNASA